jgi:hypothetical protein
MPAAALKTRHLSLHKFRGQQIVSVEELDQGTRAILVGPVSGRRRALILLVDYSHLLVIAVPIEHVSRPVRRPVVHDNDLYLGPRLSQRRVQGIGNVVLHIVGRHADGNKWTSHLNSASCSVERASP